MSTTWGEIKLATLQKLFSSNGTTITVDSSNSEYIYAMPQACNEALELLSTAAKFLIGQYTYVNRPVEPIYGYMKNFQIVNNDANFEALGAKAYYFRAQGHMTYTIFVDGEVYKTEEINSAGYSIFKGLIEATDIQNVRLLFVGEYPANIKNVALYGNSFESDENVDDYEPYIRIKMDEVVDDFYQLAPNEIYFEGDGEPEYIAADQYFQEAGKYLIIPREKTGAYTIYYRQYPETITQDTPDEYELPVAPEVAALIPLYMASQLYKDDDNGIATVYRNEFEVGRESLTQQADVPQFEEFVSLSGWC